MFVTHFRLIEFLSTLQLYQTFAGGLFHQQDQRWNSVFSVLSKSKVMNQTNFDGNNYQTQTGSDNKNIIGGIHHHYGEPSQETQTVKTILMLSANPNNTEIHRSRTGVREIREALNRAKAYHNQLFDIQDRFDTSAIDISQELSAMKPYIVDFSGYENGIEGVTLEMDSREDTTREPEKLIANLFKYHNNNIRCILLNGCYLESQAKEIVKHIDFVIGISQNLDSINIITFRKEFYYQIGSKRTIKDSYDLSCNLLQRKGIADYHLPTFLNRHDEAIREDLEGKLISCNLAMKIDENNVKLWTKKADLLGNLGRLNEANDACKRASTIQPEDYKIKNKQNNKLEQSGNYDKAVDAYEKALVIEDTDYNIWWKKGKALFKLKKYSEAVQSYNRALALNPPSPDNYVMHREHGLILRRLKKYEESIISYKKSLSIEPKYRTSNYEKRQVYKKMYFGSN